MGSFEDFKKRNGISDRPKEQEDSSFASFLQRNGIQDRATYELSQHINNAVKVSNALSGTEALLPHLQDPEKKRFDAVTKDAYGQYMKNMSNPQYYLDKGVEAKKQADQIQSGLNAAGKLAGFDDKLALGDEKTAELKQQQTDLMFQYYSTIPLYTDYSEKSQYVSEPTGNKRNMFMVWQDLYPDDNRPFVNLEYEAINGNAEAKGYLEGMAREGQEGLGALVAGLNDAKRELQFISDTERGIYNYLYRTNGAGAASQFLQYITDDLNARGREKIERDSKAYAQEHPWLASFQDVLVKPVGSMISHTGQLLDYVPDGEYTPNAPYNNPVYESNAIRNTVGTKIQNAAGGGFWGDAAQFGYGTVMSMGDFLMTTGITGGMSKLSLAIMGSGAAASTTVEALDRGLNDDQAFWLGTIAGATEIVAEKCSLEKLFDLKKLKNHGTIRYVVQNVLSEGGEEVGTELVNTIADCVIAADESQMRQAIEAYQAKGKTEGQAFALWLKDEAIELGLAGLGGMVSGGVMGGGSAVINSASIHSTANQIAGGKLKPDTNALVQGGLAMPEDTRGHVLAKQISQAVENGTEPDVMAVAELYRICQAEGLNTGSVADNAPQDTVPQTPEPTTPTAENAPLDMGEIMDETIAELRGAPSDPVATALETLRNGGTVSNKLASDILANAKAVQALVQQTGMTLPDTASGRRAAVKEAVTQLAEKQQAAQALDEDATTQTDGVKAQLRAHQDTLNAMEPAAQIDVPTQFSDLDIAGKQNWVIEKLRPTDYKVDRKGFGVISFAKKRLKSAFKYFKSGSAEEASFEALPYVLANGVEISSHENHKGREYRTVTIAAPVVINGKRGNMAVVVKQTNGNYYKVHRILTPDGSVFQLPETESEADRADGGVTKNGSLATSNSAASPETSVAGNASGQRQTRPLVPASDKSIYHSGENVNGQHTTSPPTESVGAAPSQVFPSPYDSMGAAPAGFSPVTSLQYQYGTIPEGENPVRPDTLPKRDMHGGKVSHTARTVLEAKATPDEFVDLLNQQVVGGVLSYVEITNSETVQKAIDHITEEGWDAALHQWHYDVLAGKTGADMAAVGALLLNNAAKAGDKKTWLDILSDYQFMGTNTAQGLQALRILKTLEPSDQLYHIKRSIKQMAKDMHLQTDIQLDEDLVQEYETAQTDEARDAALEKIQQSVADQIPPTFMDKLTALRYVNMLGNLRTQARNVVGNTTMTLLKGFKNLVATSLEILIHKASGGKLERTKSFTVSKALRNACKEDFASVQSAILAGGKYSDSSTQATEFAQSIQDKRQIFKFKPLEGYRKLTNRVMEGGDLIFSKGAYARALAGYLKAHGIKGSDLSGVDTALMDNARLYAIQQAQETTFRDSNWLSDWVSQIGRKKDKDGKYKTPLIGRVAVEGLMPFRKTPANVLIRAEEYSPLGAINSIVTSIRAMQKDSTITGAQVIDSWAKTLTGTGIFGLGMLLNSLGLLSAGADDDEDKEGAQSMNGQQNYSFTIPGTDINFTVECFSPTAMPLLMGAELMEMVNDGGFSLEDLGSSLTSLADPMIQMSMLQGIDDTLDGIRYSDNNLGQLAINLCLSYLTQGLTNTALGQLERTFEDSRMTTYIDKDSPLPDWLQRELGRISAKTPGWDFQQTPYVNAKGQEEKNPDTWINAIYNTLSPSYIEQDVSTDLDRELDRLNDAQSDVNVYLKTPEKTVNISGKKRNLSSEEWTALAKAQGQLQTTLAQELVNSPDYDALSDVQKAKALENVYAYAREKARVDTLDDYTTYSESWMTGIAGNEVDAILQKTVDSALSGAFSSLTSAWSSGASDSAAIAAMDTAYKTIASLSADNQSAVRDDLDGRMRAFVDARDAGMTSETFAGLYRQYREISQMQGDANSRQQKWLYALDKAGVTGAQRSAIEERLYFAAHIRQEAQGYQNMVDAGLDMDTADYVFSILDDILPEEGRSGVRDIQKLETIVSDDRLTDKEVELLMPLYLDDGPEKRWQTALDEGYTTEQFVEAYRIILDKETGTTKQQAIRQIQQELGISYRDAKALHQIYCENLSDN